MGILKNFLQQITTVLPASRLQQLRVLAPKVLKISPEIFVGACAIFTVCAVWLRGMAAPFDHDEFEAVHSAWLTLQGEMPYEDFFQHHHPLLYYALAPVLALTGESAEAMITCRVLIGGVWAATLLFTAMLARRLFDNLTALIALLLLASWGVVAKSGMQIRPDVPYVCLMMAALVLLYPKSGRPGRVALAAGGLCCALAFLFLQKAVFPVAALALCMVFRVIRGRLTMKDFFYWAAGGVAGVLPFYALLGVTGVFENYFFLNWVLNAHWLRERPVHLSYFMSVSYAHYVLGFVGVALSIRHEERAQIALIALANTAIIYVARTAWSQYILGACPLLAVMGGYAFVNLTQRRLLSLAVAVWFMLYLPGTFRKNYDSKKRDAQLAVIQSVLDVTDRNDIVHDGDIRFNLFRRDLDYFWFSISPESGLGTYRSLRPYTYDVKESIQKKRPAVVSTVGVNPKHLMKDYVKFSEIPSSRRAKLIFIRKDLAPKKKKSKAQ